MFMRVMVAAAGIPVLLLLFYAAPDFVLPAVVSLFSGIAAYEVLCSTGFLRQSRISLYSIILSLLIPIWVWYDGQFPSALCVLFLYAMLMFADVMGSHGKMGVEQMGGAFFLCTIIPLFFSAFLRLRRLKAWQFYILLPFVVSFCSDAFALFAGMAFGRTKLAPEISPNKTVEGSIGGFTAAIVCVLIYGLLAKPLFGIQGIRLEVLALYGAVGSVVSQFGDLAFSCIKREYGLKDFGNLFPGHGGVLDRFDSVAFCAPFLELMISALPAII